MAVFPQMGGRRVARGRRSVGAGFSGGAGPARGGGALSFSAGHDGSPPCLPRPRGGQAGSLGFLRVLAVPPLPRRVLRRRGRGLSLPTAKEAEFQLTNLDMNDFMEIQVSIGGGAL